MKPQFLIVLFLFLSCGPHAKRDNPFDPRNLKGKGTVRGVVYNRGRIAVPNTIVIIPELKLAGVVSSIEYEIQGIPLGSWTIVATAPGYSREDTTLEVLADKTIENINFILYGLPTFFGDTVHSVHLRFEGPSYNDEYYVETKTQYTHPDGLDWIGDSVFVGINQIYCRADSHSRVNDYTGYFYKNFNDSGTIDTLVGKQFIFRAKDWFSKYIGESNPHILTSIIKDTVGSLDPNGFNDTLRVDSQGVPTDSLKWGSVDLGGMLFYWDVKILRNDTVVWEIKGIPSNQTWCKVGIALPSEHYTWWVYLRDADGNLSGTEGQFVVVP